MDKYIIFGDIAGRYDELMLIMEKVPKGVTPISVGDMNDRGPKSKQVFDYFMNSGLAVRCNHGHIFSDAYRQGGFYDEGLWLLNGGLPTLMSFVEVSDEKFYCPSLLDVEKQIDQYYRGMHMSNVEISLMGQSVQALLNNAVPEKYIEWLETRPMYLDFGNLIITHAPINPSIPFEKCLNIGRDARDYAQVDNSLLWNRGRTRRLKNEDGSLKFQVHGHMSYRNYQPLSDREGDYGINVDSSKGSKLTGFCWPSREIIEQEYLD